MSCDDFNRHFACTLGVKCTNINIAVQNCLCLYFFGRFPICHSTDPKVLPRKGADFITSLPANIVHIYFKSIGKYSMTIAGSLVLQRQSLACNFINASGHRHKQAQCRSDRGIHCAAQDSNALSQATYAAPIIPEIAGSPNIVIIGGTGRVGSSTAVSLLSAVPKASISLASRSPESFDHITSLRPELRSTTRVAANVDDPSSVLSAIKGADLVIHTAGPFQRRTKCNVLEACIASGVPYLDVCDDTAYSQLAKSLHGRAQAAGVPAITTAGIYPGVSNVMAAHMISLARKEYDSEFNYVADSSSSSPEAPRPQRVLYSYYTAGSGGAGPTILNTSFLLAGEDVVAYK